MPQWSAARSSVVHEPSGLEPGSSRAGSSPSSPLESLGGSTVLAARGSWRAPLLRGHRCCAPSATSHRKRENIYRCSRYMASGNKSTVFIFNWRVFNFCLVVSKEKGNMQRHPDSSGLESGGASSWLVNNTTRVQVWTRLELAREQH